MAGPYLESPDTKPRLWFITNVDYLEGAHGWIGFNSILTHKRSSFEHFIPSTEKCFVNFSRPKARISNIKVSACPPLPKRSPSRTLSARNKHSLRQRHSPKLETLRELRAKESETALRDAYDQQTRAYLSETVGTVPRASTPGWSRWDCSTSADDDDPLLEDEEFVLAPEYAWHDSLDDFPEVKPHDWPLPL